MIVNARLLPKAELHCHLEGAISPDLALRLGARHGLHLEVAIGADGAYVWRDFNEFLTAYDAVAHMAVTPRDYGDILFDYYAHAAAHGLIYGEMFVSLDHGLSHGATYPEFIAGLADGIDRARSQLGVEVRLVLTAVRHLGPGQAEIAARAAESFPHPYVTGFGLAGDELFGQPADFARAFDIARGAGLGLTAHAGEIAGADSVRATLAAFRPSRIGHGVRSVEDPDLVRHLAGENVTLEICPSSNLALGLFPDLVSHPVDRLRREGVRLCLSTDDPAFFHCDIGSEYQRTAAAFGWDEGTQLAMTRAAIDAAFCPRELKTKLLDRLAAFS